MYGATGGRPRGGRPILGPPSTDQRDTLPGTDPRYPVDGVDGFDVLNCLNAETGADPCANDGGLDQKIYGFVAE